MNEAPSVHLTESQCSAYVESTRVRVRARVCVCVYVCVCWGDMILQIHTLGPCPCWGMGLN